MSGTHQSEQHTTHLGEVHNWVMQAIPAAMLCKRYEAETEVMLTGIREIELTGILVKSILECGGKGKGVKWLVDF